jgi:hypothetical protein
VRLELSRREIARLFYETNGDGGLPALIELFSYCFSQTEVATLLCRSRLLSVLMLAREGQDPVTNAHPGARKPFLHYKSFDNHRIRLANHLREQHPQLQIQTEVELSRQDIGA